MSRRNGGSERLPGPLYIVLLTVLIDLIGFGIVLPILPLWAETFGASPTEIGVLSASYALMQVLFAPFWGRLSDRIGRRPVILVTLLGSAVSALMIGLANSLLVLLLARVLNGISGASYAAAQAYVADVTTREQRARGMGLIGAAFGLGFIIGPAIGAGLSVIDQSAPFFFAAGLAAVNLVLAWFKLPESRRPGAVTRQPGRIEMLRHALASRRLGPLVWLSFVATFAFVGMEATFALLGKERFGYDPTDMGMLFAYVGLAAAFGQGFLVGRVVARWGEHRVMLWGLGGTAAGLALLAAADGLPLLLLGLLLLGLFSGFAFATISALISQAATDEEQGGVLGIAASTGGAARIVGPVVAGALFQHVAPGAPLVVGAVLCAGCALFAGLWVPRPATA